MKQGYTCQTVWIIGCSSGIGEALARNLAKKRTRLILSARRMEPLQALQQDLAHPELDHRVIPFDVSRSEDGKEAVQKAFGKAPCIDRVVFMAATYKPSVSDTADPETCKNIVEVNLLGALYFIYEILPRLKSQRAAQLVICASVAGLTGLPNGQPYSATKAALINFTESLYAESPPNLDIKLINPGFVRTRITDKNTFCMPFRIETEEAAEEIAKGMLSKKFEIHFPKKFTRLVKLLSILPYSLKLLITRKMADRI